MCDSTPCCHGWRCAQLSENILADMLCRSTGPLVTCFDVKGSEVYMPCLCQWHCREFGSLVVEHAAHVYVATPAWMFDA